MIPLVGALPAAPADMYCRGAACRAHRPGCWMSATCCPRRCLL